MTAITANNFLKLFLIISQITTPFLLVPYIYCPISCYGTQRYHNKRLWLFSFYHRLDKT